MRDENAPRRDETPGPLWKRLGWFAILWIGGFVALTVVAMIIRAFIG
jgi:hypothetical protein